MPTRRGVNNYPRPGERIAPATLAQALLELAPERLVAGTPAAGLRLCDLDETIWSELPPEAIGKLSEVVVMRVSAACARKAFDGQHFPRPPEGLDLRQLRLEHRTHLCLAREGFEDDPQSLGDRTIGEVLAMRAFGPRCLVDLLSALETALYRERRLHRPLTEEAERLAKLPEAVLTRKDDSRFGPLIHALDAEAESVEDLADRILARTQDPPDPAYAARQVQELRQRIASTSEWTLEEELIQIFASTPHRRNREVLIGYYGWQDGQSRTLAEIGARYGMTRERTRQICAKLVRRKDPARILAPVMDRTLTFVAQRLPCSVARLEEEIRGSGLTRVGLSLENVEVAARLLGRPAPFALVPIGKERLAVRPEEAAVPPAVVEAAKKEVYYHGAATVGRIVELLTERFGEPVQEGIVAATLELLDGFCWLDRAGGWFRLTGVAKHGLPRAIDKVLAVAGRIHVRDLAAAVSRNRRMWAVPPGEAMLLEFCRQTHGVRVEGSWVLADPPRRWQDYVTGVEAQLVAILREHGPILERGALEDLCIASGMNRFSFHAFIASSPVIAQYGHSVYGLLGADVSAADVKSLIARHRAERGPTRVLENHGRTEDGRIWLSYRLSKAASTYAVITVPAALKDIVCGKFDLVTAEGRRVGTLAAKGGRAWGLGAYLRQQGARMDDSVRVVVDLEKRQAHITVATV